VKFYEVAAAAMDRGEGGRGIVVVVVVVVVVIVEMKRGTTQ